MKLFCLKHNGVMKVLVNQQGRRKGCNPLVHTPDNPHFVLEICNQNYIQLNLLSKLQSKLQIIHVVQVWYPSRYGPHLPKDFYYTIFAVLASYPLDKPGNGYPWNNYPKRKFKKRKLG